MAVSSCQLVKQPPHLEDLAIAPMSWWQARPGEPLALMLLKTGHTLSAFPVPWVPARSSQRLLLSSS